MNQYETEYVRKNRIDGVGFGTIAKALGLPLSTVKSYCRRHDVVPKTGIDTVNQMRVCLHCGKAIGTLNMKGKKKFCSDKCRLDWWHQHRHMEKKAVDHRCPVCGNIYRTAKEQIYCSRLCYFSARYGGNACGSHACGGKI